MKNNLSSQFSTRQFMRSKDFEIYYYNDTDLSKVADHTHSYYEFYFFIDGNITLWIEDSCYNLNPGDMVLIPPHTHHRADISTLEKPYQRFVFWISEAYCNDLMDISPDYVYLMQHARVSHNYVFHYDVIGFNTIQYKILQLIEELHFDRFGRESRISLCVRDLILHLNRTVYEAQHPSTPKETQDLYQNIITYIEDHLEDDLTLEILAQEFYVSKYHIAHVFKEKFGISVHQFILKKRLAMCRDAILSNTEISEAFLLCGFKDYSSFYRAFKKEYGISPKEYKELNSSQLNNMIDPS